MRNLRDIYRLIKKKKRKAISASTVGLRKLRRYGAVDNPFPPLAAYVLALVPT